MSINVYPSGIVTDGGTNEDLNEYNMKERDASVFHLSTGDFRINDFNRRIRGNPSLVDTIEFRLECIEAMVSLYGDFLKWLKFQYKENTLFHGHNIELLTDTVRYIVSGKRNMQLYTHEALLDGDPIYKPGCASDRRWSELLLEVPGVADFDFSNYIGMWCRHPTGFHDMLYTTWLLFGEYNWKPEVPNGMTFISNV